MFSEVDFVLIYNKKDKSTDICETLERLIEHWENEIVDDMLSSQPVSFTRYRHHH